MEFKEVRSKLQQPIYWQEDSPNSIHLGVGMDGSLETNFQIDN